MRETPRHISEGPVQMRDTYAAHDYGDDLRGEREAAKDVDWDRTEKDDRATELLRHARQKLGAQPIQDAGKYLA
eukprot:4503511-Pyramimonas_sp.AAC.1